MTYRLPSLNTLRAFEAAGRHLSFRAAADEIGVTSGAVSQQVRKLEQSLGVDLFRRLPHGLLLTAQGEAYLPKITKVFEDLTDATEDVAPGINGKKFSVGVCPKAAAVLPKGWPFGGHNLEPYVRDCVTTSNIDRVRNGDIDCLIRLGEGPSEQLEVLKILPDSVPTERSDPLHLVCKTGLANCRQTAELVSNLQSLAAGGG